MTERVVILAGGFGTRLAERTDAMPKPMVEIGGRPILWHLLKYFGHFGHDSFVIACGYRGEVIKRYFLDLRDQSGTLAIDYRTGTVERQDANREPWRVELVDTGYETETGGRLRRLRDRLAGGGTFLMTYGDGLADVDLRALLAFHRKHGRLATFTAVRHVSPFGRPVLEGDRAVGFAEKPADGDAWISAGFFALEPAVLDEIVGEGDHVSFERVVLPKLAQDGELMAHRHEGFWHPMDTLRDVRRLNQMNDEVNPPWKIWERDR